MGRTGKCACGAIAYEFSDPTQDGVICYCGTCRTISSDHSFNLRTSRDAVKVTKGAPKTWTDTTTNSGTPMYRSFCGDCGTALWSDPSGSDTVRFIKVGPLSDCHETNLALEVYVNTSLKHEPIPKERFGQKHFEGPSMKEV